jgi:hypothetical protein
VREDVATGQRTYELRTSGELSAALAAPLARLGVGSGTARAVELAVDREGSPVALTLRGESRVHGARDLGGRASGGGDLVELEARLDLTDPVLRSLARSLLSSRALSAARALGERIADRARIDVRRYETDESEKVKGAALKSLLGAGYEEVERVRTGRLVMAAGREPGMGWARRLDCLAPSAA